MKKFVILTDSGCDMHKELREKYDVEYVDMRILYDEKDIPADLDWKDISFKDFYRMMRENVIFKTAQVNVADYCAAFERIIESGCDVLSISTSSGLSASYNASLVAAEKTKEKYPDAKIFCVDPLISGMGLGLLCMAVSDLRAEGKSIEEAAKFAQDNRLNFHQFGTVESLVYLKRAGRVSAMSAVFGGLLQVKPIIISDVKGRNVASEKVKGRKNSIVRLAELTAEVYEKSPFDRIGIVHADCEEDAKTLKALVREKLGDGPEIVEGYVGPIIGGSSGPGMLGIYTFGKTRTFDVEKK